MLDKEDLGSMQSEMKIQMSIGQYEYEIWLQRQGREKKGN